MKLSEILENIPHTTDKDIECQKIEYDSRKAGSGDLFVCLVGAKSDGHNYAMRAYDNGCRAFLCERKIDLPPDAVQAVTADTRSALAAAAANFYSNPADKLHIIGITGTKGKTTTALLTAAVLNAAGLNCAYIGSNGVIINGHRTETVNTTPESLELHHYFSIMVSSGVKYAVLEVSSQALGHHRVDGIPFEVTAFTNLSRDHIGEGEHPTFEDYKQCKKHLFDSYGSKFMVYNADDAAAEYMKSGYNGKTVSFAADSDADFRAVNIEKYRSSSALGVRFDCITGAWRTEVSLMSPGEFSVYNGLCAMAICSCYGISRDFAASVLCRTPVQGRFEIVEGIPGRTFIIDYAHNGLSLTSALKTLREYNPHRIICLFGSVGGRTKERRRELAEAADALADYAIVTSDNPNFEPPEEIALEIASYIKHIPYECITDRNEAILRAVNISSDGDIVLLAGKGHETYQLILGQKVPFCEREILKEACAVKIG